MGAGLLRVLVCAIALISAEQPTYLEAADAEAGVLELKPTKFLPRDVIARLAKIPDTARLLSDPRSDVFQEIFERCGWLDPALLVEFAHLNSLPSITLDGLDGLQTKEIKFPLCARVSASAAVEELLSNRSSKLIPSSAVRDSIISSAEKIVTALQAVDKDLDALEPGRRASFITENKIQSALKLANAFLNKEVAEAEFDLERQKLFSQEASHVAQQLESVAQASKLGQEDRSLLTTIPLIEPEQTAAASGAVKSLMESGLQVSTPVPAFLAPIVGEEAEKDCLSNAPFESPAIWSMTWPLRFADLLDALLLNAFERERQGRGLGIAKVLVADTGFPISLFRNSTELQPKDALEARQFFLPSDFYANEDEKGQDPESPPMDNDGDRFYANVYGISLQKLSGDIEPLASYSNRDHGLSVASLVLGGMQLGRYRTLRTLPIRLHFANLMDSTVPGRLQLKGDELRTLVDYAKAKQLDVVNLSFSSDAILVQLEEGINQAEGRLFVVAAGNNGQSLEAKQRWPAVLGGRNESRGGVVITVAAHRPDGGRLMFSNYSPQYVDIAAPGCRIPVPILKMNAEGKLLEFQVETEHGTSLAAPLVSFVGALLKAEGLSAYDIKRRIILSADHDPKLDKFVKYGARLNVAAALSIYDDVVITRSAEGTVNRLRGRFKRFHELLLCGKGGTVRNFYRIDRIKTKDALTFRSFTARQIAGQRIYEEPAQCDMPDADAPKLQFYDVDSLTTRVINLGEVETIIMRER